MGTMALDGGNAVDLPIRDVRVSPGVHQARKVMPLRARDVVRLMKADAGGEALPPCVVYFDGSGRWLAEGFAGYLARLKAGRDTVRAVVLAGTASDPAAHVARAASPVERRTKDAWRAAEEWLRLWPADSDRSISRWLGLGAEGSQVNKVRRALVRAGKVPDVAERTYADRAGVPRRMRTQGLTAEGLRRRGGLPEAPGDAAAKERERLVRLRERLEGREEIVADAQRRLRQLARDVGAIAAAVAPLIDVCPSWATREILKLARVVEECSPAALCPECAGRGCPDLMESPCRGEGTLTALQYARLTPQERMRCDDLLREK